MIEWLADPTDTYGGVPVQNAHAGAVCIANVRRSDSGRWRWEIARMPGMSGFRDDFSGWKDSEAEAKGHIELLWNAWMAAAGLTPKPVVGEDPLITYVLSKWGRRPAAGRDQFIPVGTFNSMEKAYAYAKREKWKTEDYVVDDVVAFEVQG